jgi:hypothetical protein
MGLLLEDELRERLEQASAAANRSVGAEIRERLAASFEAEDAADAITRSLAATIGKLATWVLTATGHKWYAHPAAHKAFMRAIGASLANLRPEGDPVFAPGEKKSVLIDSDDPEVIGLAVEAIVRNLPPMTPELRRLLDEKQAELQRKLLQQYSPEEQREFLERNPRLRRQLERYPEHKKEGGSDPSESNT